MVTQQEAKEAVQMATETKNKWELACIDLLIQSASLLGKSYIHYDKPINDAVRFDLKQRGFNVSKEMFSQREGYSTEIRWS